MPTTTVADSTNEYWVDQRGRLRTNAFTIADTAADGLVLKGANWFGLESAACYIGGGHMGSLETFAAFLAQHGFNAVRVPLAMSEVIAAGKGQPSACLNAAVYETTNPALKGLGYLEQVGYLARLLGRHGMLVLLDMHVTAPGVWPDAGTVTDPVALEQAWETLAEHFCSSSSSLSSSSSHHEHPQHRFWNIFAADLKNEPHGTYWGPPPPNAPQGMYSDGQRWDTIASRLASKLHQRCQRWVMFVEGVDHCKGYSDVYGCEKSHWVPRAPACTACTFHSAAGQDDTTVPSAFWGENLVAASSYPIQVMDAQGALVEGKIVLSPHTYGPSVHFQDLFAAPNFPANMESVWDAIYGSLHPAYAIVIGEWGGRAMGLDEVWQRAFADYLKRRRFGSFYWSLNPESADTGGLLSSWAPLVAEDTKLEILSQDAKQIANAQPSSRAAGGRNKKRPGKTAYVKAKAAEGGRWTLDLDD